MVSERLASPFFGGRGRRPYPKYEGTSTQQLLELLERARQDRIARRGAADVEAGVAGTVTAQPSQPTPDLEGRAPNVFDRLVAESRLPPLPQLEMPVSSPTAVPTPVPTSAPRPRPSGMLAKSKELVIDLPKALYESLPTDPTMPWDWGTFVERDSRTGAPRYMHWDFNRNQTAAEKASLGTAISIITGQVSDSLDSWQKAAAIPPLLTSVATSKIPGYDKIPKGPLSYSDKAPARASDVVSKFLSGDIPFGNVADELLAIHKDEPYGVQMFQELTSPFGLMELATGGIPFRGGRALRTTAQTGKAIKPVAAALPSVEDMAQTVTMRPEHQFRMESGNLLTNPLGKITHLAYRHLNPQALVDVDDPLHVIKTVYQQRETAVRDRVKSMNAWVLREGDPIKLFNLDDQMKSKLILNSDGTRAHFFEIAEERGRRFKLTSEQETWLKNWDDTIETMRQYLVKEGVKDHAYIGIKPKADVDYFPRFWNMFNDIRLGATAGTSRSAARKSKFYEHSRSYAFANEALEAKLWTSYGDPMKVVNTVFSGMYNDVMDKRLEDLIRPFGKKLEDRVSPYLLKAQSFTDANITALKEIKQFVGKVRHAKGPARMVPTRILRREIKDLPESVQNLLDVAVSDTYSVTKSEQGKFFALRPDGTLIATAKRGFRTEDTAWRAAANDLFLAVRNQEDWVPENIRNLVDDATIRESLRSQWRGRKVAYTYARKFARAADEASLRTGKERAAAFNAIDEDLKVAAAESRLRAFDLKRQISTKEATQGYFGEVQFPGTSLGGLRFTPAEVAERFSTSYPERLVASPSIFKNREFLNMKEIEELKKILDKRPDKNLFTSTAASISSVLRTFQAAFDWGAPLIHGLPLLGIAPARWADSVALSWKAMGNRTVMARLVTDHWTTVEKLAKHGQLGGAGSEYVDALRSGGLINKTLAFAAGSGMEAEGMTRAAFIPVRGVGRGGAAVVGRFESQFDAFLLAAKIHMWEAMEPVAKQAAVSRGMAFLPEEELANQVAKLTGSVNMDKLGMSPTIQQAAGAFLLFAPKYRLATYGLMADIAKGNIRGDIARTALRKMLAGGMSMYLAIGLILHQKPNLDPRYGNAFTYQIGGLNTGFGGAFLSTTKFAAAATSQILTEPEQAITVWKRDSKLNRFIRGQVSPVSSIGWDIIEGRDYLGDPVFENVPNFLEKLVAQKTLPFWGSSMLDTPKAGWSGLLSAVPEFGGLRSFPMSQLKSARYTANTVALKEGDISYDDMSRRQQLIFLRDHPKISRLMEEAFAYSGQRGSEIRFRTNEFYKGIDDYMDADYMPRLNTLLAHLDSVQKEKIEGIPFAFTTVKGIRDELGVLGKELGEFYDDHQKDYPDVILNLDKQRAKAMPGMPTEDVAYHDYIRSFVLAEFEIIGEQGQTLGFNYQARVDAENDFIARWGDSIYQLVKERLWISKETPPAIMELELGRRKLHDYFQMPYLILERQGLEHLTPDYKLFTQTITNSRDQERHWANNPGDLKTLKQIDSAAQKARAMVRERNPDWDAWLYRWDYGGNPRHPNTLADLALAKRTPVFLR